MMNRIALGSIGLVSLLLGGVTLVGHSGRLSWVNPGSSVVGNRASVPVWLWWIIVVAAAAMGMACLRWAAAQVPRPPAAVRWRARPPESSDRIELDAGLVAQSVARDIRGYDGVRSAAARVSGPAWAPCLDLVVIAESDTDVGALRARILEHAVPRLCQAVAVDTIPVTLKVDLAQAR